MNNKFSKHFIQVFDQAGSQANESGQALTNEHLVSSLLQAQGSVAYELLNKLGMIERDLNLDKSSKFNETNSMVNPQLEPITRPSSRAAASSPIRLSDPTKRALTQAVLVAANYNHHYVGTEHLLLSLLEVDRRSLIKTLSARSNYSHKQQVEMEELRTQLEAVLKNTGRFSEITAGFGQAGKAVSQLSSSQSGTRGAGSGKKPSGKRVEQNLRSRARKTRAKSSEDSLLAYFAHELTSEPAQRRINPVVGRAQEIERVIQILARRDKNNPVLIGDPGVGKTAIVEGLSKRIHEGDVPNFLHGKRVFSLDLSALLAGTMYRGEFESRLKQVMDEIRQDSNLILFIDELHNIVGAGSAAGSLDAANILKPALARGEIRLVGATTFEEYKKNIEPDPAFERRLQTVQVSEPTIKETVEILRGIKDAYERHHNVDIDDEALVAAARLSARYLPERFLPDKAIDLVDEAAAKITVKARPSSRSQEKNSLQKQLQAVVESKQQAVERENFPHALALKQQERDLQDSLDRLEASLATETTRRQETITEANVAQLVAQVSGVPVGELIGSKRTHLKDLTARLSRRIIGQAEAIQALSEAIKRSQVGLGSSERPLGSFMFLGPTGVGKTETAKVLAEEVFHDAKALIRFDMSEFAEGFNVSRLLGAPAGYVGFREGGQLTEAVRRRPYSVVLFDEIEKAHPEIFNVLLQILEDGYVNDAVGKQVSFRNTIVILTSNIGLKDFNRGAQLGFAQDSSPAKLAKAQQNYQEIKESVINSLRSSFRPEFINRLDRLIVFQPLRKSDLRRIVALELNKFITQWSEQRLTIRVDRKLISFLSERSLRPAEGARAIRRTIQDLVIAPLADKLVESAGLEDFTISISANSDKVTFTERLSNVKKKEKVVAKV